MADAVRAAWRPFDDPRTRWPPHHPAADFHVGPLTTALAETELIEEVWLPYLPPATGWGFEEVARRAGDFAIVAMGATVALADGAISAARIAITRRRRGADAHGERGGCCGRRGGLDAASLELAARAVMEAIEPGSDLHASATTGATLQGRSPGAF